MSERVKDTERTTAEFPRGPPPILEIRRPSASAFPKSIGTLPRASAPLSASRAGSTRAMCRAIRAGASGSARRAMPVTSYGELANAVVTDDEDPVDTDQLASIGHQRSNRLSEGR